MIMIGAGTIPKFSESNTDDSYLTRFHLIQFPTMNEFISSI